jgi:hypothetical protein
MGELLTWVSANWQAIVGTAGVVVMGASIMVKAIAPHTANTTDDKAATLLDKAYSWLNKLALNPPKE